MALGQDLKTIVMSRRIFRLIAALVGSLREGGALRCFRIDLQYLECTGHTIVPNLERVFASPTSRLIQSLGLNSRDLLFLHQNSPSSTLRITITTF